MQFLREKDLERHFRNDEGKEASKGDEEDTETKEDQDIVADPPLYRAVELIKSWEIFKGIDSAGTDQIT